MRPYVLKIAQIHVLTSSNKKRTQSSLSQDSVCITLTTEAVGSSFNTPYILLCPSFRHCKLYFLLRSVCFTLCRFTQACSTRSSGPVSPTAYPWMRNCCLSWWRRRATPRTWWASGTSACTRRSVCPLAGALTRTLVKPVTDHSGIKIWTSHVDILINSCPTAGSRLPDRQRGLLHSCPLFTHLSSQPDPLCTGSAGRRGRRFSVQGSLFNGDARPEGHRHY